MLQGFEEGEKIQSLTFVSKLILSQSCLLPLLPLLLQSCLKVNLAVLSQCCPKIVLKLILSQSCLNVGQD